MTGRTRSWTGCGLFLSTGAAEGECQTKPMSDVKQEIRGFVVENFLFGEAQDLQDDTSFLEQGFIDSTGVLELVAHLEQTYRIKISNTEIVPENLDSVEQIAAFVRRKRDAALPGDGHSAEGTAG